MFLRIFRPTLFLCLCACFAEAATIVDVRVLSRNKQEVSASSVLAYVQQKPGETFSQERVNQDIRRLQETERYSYVSAAFEQEQEGLTLIYTVEERPKIDKVRVRGGEHFSNSKIKNLLELNPNDSIDESILRKNLEAVTEKYGKDYYPNVTYDTSISTVDDRGYVDIDVEVKEGPRAKVTQIRFSDTSEYTRNDLRKAMQQKQRGIFSWITGRGRYQPDLLSDDLATIEELHRRKGYLDVKVGEPEIERSERGSTKIKLPVEKNEKYFVRGIQIDGATLFPVSLLGTRIPISVGDPAATHLIEAGRRAIRDFYNNRGYSNTRVTHRLLLSGQERLVDVVYDVNEGNILTIRNVLIKGNTRTKDHVIRRELNVFPGDHLNEVRVRNSVARLRNLGFFGHVSQNILPTKDPSIVDVAFEIEEGRSGQFVAGAGFSSVDNVTGFIELSQGNFDISEPWKFSGGGEKLKMRLQLGSERRDAELTYVRPWLFDKRITLNSSLYTHERRFLSDDYDQRNTGASIGLRKALGPNWRGGLTYSLEEIEVYDVSETASDAIKAEEGENIQSGLELTFTRDSRNHVWIPTEGGRIVANAGFSGGPLGFDTDLYRLGLRSSFFRPVVMDHVLNLQGWIQGVDYYGDTDHVPIFDRLFLGGPRTIRGFDFRDVGPRDDTGEVIGGQSSMFASAEYTIPLTDQFRYALFYDWGVVNLSPWDYAIDGFNSSYGMGIRIDMPGFPLRFDYSWQHEADEINEESGGRFSFLIGHSF